MKHAYVPRTTSYSLNPGDELNDLRMSEQVRPLYDHVRKFIRETVDPMAVEFVPARREEDRPLELYAGPARGAAEGQGQGQGRACGTSSCPTPRPARA